MCNPLLFLSFHFFKLEKFLKLWFLPARCGWPNLSKMEILLSFLLVTTSLHQNWLKWIYRAESHAVPDLVDAAERSVLIANSKLCVTGLNVRRRRAACWWAASTQTNYTRVDGGEGGGGGRIPKWSPCPLLSLLPLSVSNVGKGRTWGPPIRGPLYFL